MSVDEGLRDVFGPRKRIVHRRSQNNNSWAALAKIFEKGRAGDCDGARFCLKCATLVLAATWMRFLQVTKIIFNFRIAISSISSSLSYDVTWQHA